MLVKPICSSRRARPGAALVATFAVALALISQRVWAQQPAAAAPPAAALPPSSASPQPTLTFTPYHASGIYNVGDTVGWRVTAPDGTPRAAGLYTYTVKTNNLDVVKTGTLDLSTGKATIEASVDEPAMLYVSVARPPDANADASGGPFGRRRRPIALGAAVAPTKLLPVAPRPADFDAFWQAKIEMLKAIPANPVLTPGDSGSPDIEFDIVKMDHVNGTHVYGQLAKPNKPGKFPALLILQWASPPYPLQKSWVTGHARNGWLVLNIEPHDVLPDQPVDYYAALPQAIKNYQSIGEDDRDKSYFLQMYLADYRAAEYLASRPDWDGKTLVVMGTSMGGQQSLCVAGLNPRVTHVIVDEPAGCDMNGALHGRQSGYPNFPANDPRVMATAPYFDPINFAPHITATCLVAMGFVDTTAPPAGIWTAFDEIPGPKEAAPMVDSPHNNLATPAEQQPYNARSAEWLRTLVTGETVTPNAARVQP
jgi:cephalosporin-C deacetylase-like acetyl esterase